MIVRGESMETSHSNTSKSCITNNELTLNEEGLQLLIEQIAVGEIISYSKNNGNENYSSKTEE